MQRPMNKTDAEPTKLMWKSKSREELDEEIRKREIRDKNLSKRGILISEVPSDLKEYHAEDIKKSQETSMAGEIWKRQHQRDYKGNGKIDTRKQMGEDWWNTPEIIAVAKKGIKAENKQKRKQKIKDFFYTYSGCKFFNNHNRKKKEDRENEEIAQEFYDSYYMKAFIGNERVEMSEVLAKFLSFIYGRKGFRGVMTDEMTKNLAVAFMKQNNIKEVENPDIKMLLAFYKFWREK